MPVAYTKANIRSSHHDENSEDTLVLKHHLGAKFHDRFFPELRAKKTSSTVLNFPLSLGVRKLPCCILCATEATSLGRLPGITPPPPPQSPLPPLILEFCDGAMKFEGLWFSCVHDC